MNTGSLIAGALLLLVGACTSPLSREGRLPPPGEGLADATYALAPVPGDSDAAVAGAVSLVRDALADKGYRETANGRYRLEVGLASAAPELEVQRAESGESAARSMRRNPIVLCRPRRYVLTVGMIDRASGEVLFRNAAAARHCGTSPGKILPKMVRAAVNG
ncbi:DUF4136 domain-containing protein [Sphingomonas psychrotolerans]|uniref:DUF4136 domain-containing protein n=1 Tax=Sphingomonas psychrotolerans TaxID=1327635 RepID=A0A2K8MHI6_9SPHN|nr:hypothetical protein [Sphingomonas psychrotolerans]ATY33358.1 hypothetical protein CVN68_16455 [Sphingomonas psychrotolerans]